MTRTVHIVGAGVAGLAAAVRLAQRGVRVAVHESAGQAGGRCRSYHDAQLGMSIDNGNHLLLSGNHATLAYLKAIGAAHRLPPPEAAAFPFIDLKTRERWTLRFNDGRIPWWVFDKTRRIPGTGPTDYLALARLLLPGSGTVADRVPANGVVYDRLVEPLIVAALNTDPAEASAALAAAVIRETLAAGGRACRPLIARDGLSPTLIEPALAALDKLGSPVRFNHRLRELKTADHAITGLDFGDDVIAVEPSDAVVLAVPPVVATDLVPGLAAPTEFRAIVNAHFRVDPPADFPPMIGLINATTEWIFAFPGRLSVTISAADRLLDAGRDELASTIWRDVAAVAGLPGELPPWQIVRERRATFAATPQQNSRRPQAATRYGNLFLAGDWTATGLPATIEGAIRSGNRAADLVG